MNRFLITRVTHLSRARALPLRPLPRSFPHARLVATSVSGRPASQTPGHAAQNIKEEVGNTASDLAKTIAGANFTEHSVAPAEQSFAGITKEIAGAVPKPVMILGLAGGLPYLGASATTVYLANQAGQAANGVITNIDPSTALTVLNHALNVQVTYGAVLLSFLGALHWGMEFAAYGGQKGYSRLVLGIAPVLFAWPTLALAPTSALIAQWVGFTGLWWADSRVTSLGWAPKWYSQYRFYLSILVGTCIIGSLAGTSYYGPVGGHGLLSHDLQSIRDQRKERHPERSGVVGGDIEAKEAPKDADRFVVIKKKEKKEEESKGKKNEGEDSK